MIEERIASGEAQAQVAADYGISRQQAGRIATKEKKKKAAKAERKRTVAKLGTKTLGVHHGDFRKIGNMIEDDSVDLIFTDPPYDKESLPAVRSCTSSTGLVCHSTNKQPGNRRYAIRVGESVHPGGEDATAADSVRCGHGVDAVP